MKQRVTLITLGVADLARARGFYEALGWQTRAKPEDDVVFFEAGGLSVALWDRGSLAEDSTAEVDAIMDEAAAAGATIGRSGAETFWGGYSGVFLDPDGHPWEVAHNPHWSLRDDGSVVLPD